MIPYKHKQHQKESIKQIPYRQKRHNESIQPTQHTFSNFRESRKRMQPFPLYTNSKLSKRPITTSFRAKQESCLSPRRNSSCPTECGSLSGTNRKAHLAPHLSTDYTVLPNKLLSRTKFPHNVGTDMVCPFFQTGFTQNPIGVPIYIR